jgi:enamine deaminase RidA (YjgF/YER057c/UK114 family)
MRVGCFESRGSQIDIHPRERKGNAMSFITSRRRLVFSGASTIAAGLLLGRSSDAFAEAAANPTGLASKLAPGPNGIQFLDYDPARRWAAGSRVGDIAYLAGVTPRDAVTGKGVDGTIEQQAEHVCKNIEAALKAFGTDFAHVFKVTVYLTNMDHLIPVARVRAKYHPRPVPSTTIQVSRLSEPYFLLEIDAMALIPKS